MAKQWDQQSGVAGSSTGRMPSPGRFGFAKKALSTAQGVTVDTSQFTRQAGGTFEDVRDELLASVKSYDANEDVAAGYGNKIGG
ncbi:hypothetical protein [Tessaracoccus sp. OH4464_COT-324]|uniref:hypothetical protein n=1 Tax=Tessaracoccus sp. OH4464_COT-324 TaxID=2491059 RepID=UPI00131A07B0|nr:hypothetical protein [Tessaracoccus sp. OH4464_COT-324]